MNLLLTLLLVGAQDPSPGGSTGLAERLKVSIESKVETHRPGMPLLIRFTIENPTDDRMNLAEPIDYTEGLEITAPGGKVVKTFGKTKDIRRTYRSDGHGFIGRTVDISRALAVSEEHEGWYRLRWKLGNAVSEPIRIFVIRDYLAEIETNLGKITIEFYADIAPNHVQRFVELARSKFYEKTTFHRVIPGFMMQGGMPRDPAKVPKKRLAAEFSNRPHVAGTVSMARETDPNSASTQFFICFNRVKHLDGRYTVFGQVIDGEDVVQRVEKARTDHSPCGCGAPLSPRSANGHCGKRGHHEDRPLQDILIKKVTIKVKKEKRRSK